MTEPTKCPIRPMGLTEIADWAEKLIHAKEWTLVGYGTAINVEEACQRLTSVRAAYVRGYMEDLVEAFRL